MYANSLGEKNVHVVSLPAVPPDWSEWPVHLSILGAETTCTVWRVKCTVLGVQAKMEARKEKEKYGWSLIRED